MRAEQQATCILTEDVNGTTSDVLATSRTTTITTACIWTIRAQVER